jgi:hypothetical protein
MATWHQLQAIKRNGPIRYGDPKTWTVVTDPPNQCRSVMTGFTSREDAQAFIDRCEGFRPGEARYCFIIPPKGE